MVGSAPDLSGTLLLGWLFTLGCTPEPGLLLGMVALLLIQGGLAYGLCWFCPEPDVALDWRWRWLICAATLAEFDPVGGHRIGAAVDWRVVGQP